MNRCWAHGLNDCIDEMSKEHLVSKSVFLGDRVEVKGLKWCKDAPKTIGLSSLSSKILCRYHNSSLSSLDAAAKTCFEAIRDADNLYGIRKNIRRTKFWHMIKYPVPGKLLERWFLKTLINLTYGGDLPIGLEGKLPGVPSDVLVNTVFGNCAFKGEAGLYSVVKTGEKVAMAEAIAFSPLIYQGSFIAGALFRIKGFRFLLFLGGEGPPKPLSNLGIDEDWGDSQLNYHNREVQYAINGGISHKIIFEW